MERRLGRELEGRDLDDEHVVSARGRWSGTAGRCCRTRPRPRPPARSADASMPDGRRLAVGARHRQVRRTSQPSTQLHLPPHRARLARGPRRAPPTTAGPPGSRRRASTPSRSASSCPPATHLRAQRPRRRERRASSLCRTHVGHADQRHPRASSASAAATPATPAPITTARSPAKRPAPGERLTRDLHVR